MTLQFLDTNVLLRHLLGDHPEHSPQATAYLRSIEAGQQRVCTSDLVIFETIFTLERHYRQSKPKIREALLPLIDLPGVLLPGKGRLRRALMLYVELNLPFADAYYGVLMKDLKLTEIVTFDHDFDRIPGITRITPSSALKEMDR